MVASLRMSLIGTRIVDDYYNSPYFWAADPDAVTLAVYEIGEAAAAAKPFPDWTSVYIGTAGELSAELLNAICREAGAYVGTRPELDLHLNDDFLCVQGIVPGHYTITPPRRATVRNLKDGMALARDTDRFQLGVEPQSTYWFGSE